MDKWTNTRIDSREGNCWEAVKFQEDWRMGNCWTLQNLKRCDFPRDGMPTWTSNSTIMDVPPRVNGRHPSETKAYRLIASSCCIMPQTGWGRGCSIHCVQPACAMAVSARLPWGVQCYLESGRIHLYLQIAGGDWRWWRTTWDLVAVSQVWRLKNTVCRITIRTIAYWSL